MSETITISTGKKLDTYTVTMAAISGRSLGQIFRKQYTVNIDDYSLMDGRLVLYRDNKMVFMAAAGKWLSIERVDLLPSSAPEILPQNPENAATITLTRPKGIGL